MTPPTATPDAPDTDGPAAVVVPPRGPTVLPVVDPEGSGTPDVTDVRNPDHGTAVIKDGEVVYTPDPGFIGRDTVTVEIIDRDGTVKEVTIEVLVGRTQEPTSPFALPATLQAGTNVILTSPIRTNAGQVVRVSALCAARVRVTAFGDVRLCSVSTSGGRTVLTVASGFRVGVVLTLSAPKSGQYLPYRESKAYVVR